MTEPSQALRDAADHIEMEHERELAGGTLTELQRMHAKMHRDGDHWNHPKHPLTKRSKEPMPETPDIIIPKFGDKLPNGAIVVDYRPITPTFGIVVAHRDHQRTPWCVWTMHPEQWNSTESGSYLESLYEAGFEMDRRHGVYSR